MTDEKQAKPTAVEEFKEGSNFLAGNIRADLDDTAKSHFEEQEIQLMKHHGIYQQDDRDLRRERRKAKQDKAWMFMVRTRMPGGKFTPGVFVGLDDLCQKYGNDTLRITTRQGFQFHGIGKENLGALIKELNQMAMTTLAACGDVARNVMSNPVSDIAQDSPYDLQPLAERVSRHFLPRTQSYFDIWVDGEKLTDGHFDDLPEPMSSIGLKDGPEPIYGSTYMPRKFKIGITWAADNHVDLYTQDVGIEVVPSANGKPHGGFNIIVGGGLGSTHNKAETFPRVGDRFAWVPDEDGVVAISEAICKVQRDYGDRTNRKHARMKYLIEDWGLDKFRAEVEKMLGGSTEPAKERGTEGQDYRLGWRQQKQEGLWYVGLRIENGRIRDFENGRQLQTGLRKICKEFPELSLRLTAHHNLIIANVADGQKSTIEELLAEYKISDGSDLSALRNTEMACPALPTCGLALAEAERYMPDLISEFEKAGYGDEDISIRMSGCPNACSRPPASEIGLMGRAPGKYNVYLGGNPAGSRYNWLWRETVKDDELVATIGAVIDQWRESGKSDGKSFGDWCDEHRESLLQEAN
jgi:sulfite reductase beta subunit-like hemoprotein